MNLLTRSEIQALNIVQNDQPRGWRDTTYDSTVGRILTREGELKTQSHTLKPRAIAWVISAERFVLPSTVTGLTTLRTTWTKRGILTLTVGIVDPGYESHLSTAVINFSKTDFVISVGEPFFRTVFFKHLDTAARKTGGTSDEYRNQVLSDSAYSSETFLTVDTLANEISHTLFSLPKWGVKIGLGALGLALVALVVPLAFGYWLETAKWHGSVQNLEERVKTIEGEKAELEKLKIKSAELEAKLLSIEQQASAPEIKPSTPQSPPVKPAPIQTQKLPPKPAARE